MVLDKAPDSIGKAVDWAKYFEANVSWWGKIQRQGLLKI